MSGPDRSTAAIAERLAASKTVRAALAALAERGDDVWIVGGAVRDAALGREVTDLDLAAAAEPAMLAGTLARAMEGHAFELSGEFATWRVAARDGTWTIDVAALRGGGIDADLGLRDFTVNAVAVPLGGGELLDPGGGLTDLEAGVLRAVSPRSFADDPLRILRAARIAAERGLTPEGETLRLAAAEAVRAAESAGERQFAELRLMLGGPDPLRALELLDELGATGAVLPEIEALRGVEQNANHHLDVYDHTLEVLRQMLGIEADLPRFAGEAAPELAAAMGEPLADGISRRTGLRFAALVHDIGKPATRAGDGAFVSFRGHDRAGAEMVGELCARLRTSRRLAGYLSALTRHHLVLGFMVRDRPLPPRRVWDYLRLTGRDSADITLLTVADRLAAQGGGVPPAAIEGHLELAREMLEAALRLERDGPPEPLLRGDELASELGIDEGPDLGRVVAELAAAQYAGEVADRDAALSHLRKWLAG